MAGITGAVALCDVDEKTLNEVKTINPGRLVPDVSQVECLYCSRVTLKPRQHESLAGMMSSFGPHLMQGVDAEIYLAHVDEGHRLMEMMYHTKGHIESPWVEFSDLGRWGWLPAVEDRDDARNRFEYPSRAAIRDMVGFGHEHGGIIWNFEHVGTHPNELHTQPDKSLTILRFPPTLEKKVLTFFPKSGVIIAEKDFVPRAVRVDPTKYGAFANSSGIATSWQETSNSLPRLHRWSDISWLLFRELQWRQGIVPPTPLRIVYLRNINDAATMQILGECVRRFPDLHNDQTRRAYPMYPRFLLWPQKHRFAVGMKGFYALLSTPSVRMVVDMVAQHHYPHGAAAISSMEAFCELHDSMPSLRINLGPL